MRPSASSFLAEWLPRLRSCRWPRFASRPRPSTPYGRLGLERIGQLAAMPNAPLTRRFGPDVRRRLDQALGHAAEPFDALMPPEIIRRRLAFAEPIGSREALSSVVTRLCGDLCSDLAAKALGVRRLDLVFGRVDRASQAVQVKTARPNRDPAHLARLLGDRLDFIDPGFGIEDGLLIASRVEPLAPKQTSAQGLSNEEAEANLGPLVDRLTTRLGEANVYRQAPIEGREPVTYPTEALKRVLEKTLGVPLFQEQAMQIAIVAAGFTPSEADQLRRAMGTFKFTDGVKHFHDKLVQGMIANGYPPEFAERTFKQLDGFGSYGFPESHAASFALIAYASSWMKCHHPDVFLAAILNAQPMGFYAPAQLVRDAEQHGVEIGPPDINHSRWDCTLEPADGGRFAVRLGLRTARGLANRDGASIVAARHGAFASVEDVWRRAGVPVAALERLAEADAFGSLGLGRRQALWEVRALDGEPLPLFAAADKRRGSLRPEVEEERVELAPMTAGREVVEDYRSRGLTLRSHPVAFLRGDLAADGYVPAGDLSATRDGRRVSVAGLVLVRQRPGSANGVLFITLEDETDIANLIVWPSLFERQRRLVLSATMIGCRGKVQREGQVIHVIAEHLVDLSGLLGAVGEREEVFPLPHGRGDEASTAAAPTRVGHSDASRGISTFPICGSRVRSTSKRETFGEARVRALRSCLNGVRRTPIGRRRRPLVPGGRAFATNVGAY